MRNPARWAARAVCAWLMVAGPVAVAQDPVLVIVDQDVDDIVGVNADPITMLATAPNVRLLGVSTVTGDGWSLQGTADTLRLLELIGRSDVPVFQGAQAALVETPATFARDVHRFGGIRGDPWLGAYAESSPKPQTVTAPPGGFAHARAQTMPAAEFIVETVRRHPHQVVLFCGGPLTNLALAETMAPDIVSLVREVVFMGTSPLLQPKTINVLLDPEAAAKVFHTDWPKLTVFTVDVTEKVHRSLELSETIAHSASALAPDYQERFVTPAKSGAKVKWFRMPDELMAAYIIDPSIVTHTERDYVDIDVATGLGRGNSVFWDMQPRDYGSTATASGPPARGVQPSVPSAEARLVDVVTDIDTARFRALFVRLMSEAGARKP